MPVVVQSYAHTTRYCLLPRNLQAHSLVLNTGNGVNGLPVEVLRWKSSEVGNFRRDSQPKATGSS